MVKIDRELIQKLRDHTGLGLMDCRNALQETNGDIEAAIDLLRKKGVIKAAKRSDKVTSEGVVHAYVHPGEKLGVMVEINCETDFVANTDDVRQFAKDLCLHITAMKPLYLKSEDVSPEFLEREKGVLREQLAGSGKPANMLEQIVEGKISRIYSEICLLQQPFIKNDQVTVQDMVVQLISKTGENIVIRRFARFEIGA